MICLPPSQMTRPKHLMYYWKTRISFCSTFIFFHFACLFPFSCEALSCFCSSRQPPKSLPFRLSTSWLLSSHSNTHVSRRLDFTVEDTCSIACEPALHDTNHPRSFFYLSISMPKITNRHSHQTARRSLLGFSMVCQTIRQSMDSRRQTCQPRHRVTALMDDSMPMPNLMRKLPKKIVGS